MENGVKGQKPNRFQIFEQIMKASSSMQWQTQRQLHKTVNVVNKIQSIDLSSWNLLQINYYPENYVNVYEGHLAYFCCSYRIMTMFWFLLTATFFLLRIKPKQHGFKQFLKFYRI